MIIAKIIAIAYNIGWIWVAPQIAYLLLPFTIILIALPKGTFK
jgi:hypothetical protein